MSEKRYDSDESRFLLNERLALENQIGFRASSRFAGKESQLLSAKDEIAAYIESLSEVELSNIETLYDDIRDEPLPENLSAYVIIPIAAGQEFHTLEQTLSQYVKQDANSSTWALLLFVNSTSLYPYIDNPVIEETREMIDKFKDAHPELHVRVTSMPYVDDAPTIGEIRSDAWNCALLDIHRSNKAHDNLIGISHDSDAGWISPDYISRMQQAAVANPDADLLTCHLSWYGEGHSYTDANKILRYWEYLDFARRNKAGRVITSDANTAVRMSSYAAISGFNRHTTLGEMIDLRQRLSLARGNDRNGGSHVRFIEGIRLRTNSRRIYQTIATGYAPDLAWERLEFRTGNDPVRTLDTVSLANRPMPPKMLRAILNEMDVINFADLPMLDKSKIAAIGRQIIGLPH